MGHLKFARLGEYCNYGNFLYIPWQYTRQDNDDELDDGGVELRDIPFSRKPQRPIYNTNRQIASRKHQQKRQIPSGQKQQASNQPMDLRHVLGIRQVLTCSLRGDKSYQQLWVRKKKKVYLFTRLVDGFSNLRETFSFITFLIDPLGRPIITVVSGHYFHICHSSVRLSVPTFQNR